MNNIEQAIMAAINSGTSIDSIGESIAEILNKAKKENEAVDARKKFIDNFISTFEDSYDHEEHDIEDAAAYFIIGIASRHPEWTPHKLNMLFNNCILNMKNLENMYDKLPSDTENARPESVINAAISQVIETLADENKPKSKDNPSKSIDTFLRDMGLK